MRARARVCVCVCQWTCLWRLATGRAQVAAEERAQREHEAKLADGSYHKALPKVLAERKSTLAPWMRGGGGGERTTIDPSKFVHDTGSGGGGKGGNGGVSASYAKIRAEARGRPLVRRSFTHSDSFDLRRA